MHTILCSNWTETKSLNECVKRTRRMNEKKISRPRESKSSLKAQEKYYRKFKFIYFVSLTACLSSVVVYRIAKIHAYCMWSERTYQHSTRARLASLIADTNTCKRVRPQTLRHQQTQPAIRLDSRLVLVYTFKCKLSTLKQWTHSHENREFADYFCVSIIVVVCWIGLQSDYFFFLNEVGNVAPGIDIKRVLCFYSCLRDLNTLQLN